MPLKTVMMVSTQLMALSLDQPSLKFCKWSAILSWGSSTLTIRWIATEQPGETANKQVISREGKLGPRVRTLGPLSPPRPPLVRNRYSFIYWFQKKFQDPESAETYVVNRPGQQVNKASMEWR